MFIRQTKKSNPSSEKIFYQYVLVRATRINGKSRQQNILYLGSQTFLADKSIRTLFAKALEEKIYQLELIDNDLSYFAQLSEEHQQQVLLWYQKYLDKVSHKKETLLGPPQIANADFEEVDTSSIDTLQPRECGAEWLCLYMAKKLGIDKYLQSVGFSESASNTALLSMIARAVFPASEHKTAKWLEDNSALYELFETMDKAPNRFALYRSAVKISTHFDSLTEQIYNNKVDMFNIQDKIMIYDLTNTYFEGRKLGSLLSQFGRSKEKRSDCKLLSFSAVVNERGFLRYSKIEKGNISDSANLLETIEQIKKSSKTNHLEQVIVIDAGIATEDNLKALRQSNVRYACVSRTRLKDYADYIGEGLMEITDNRNNKIEIKLISPKDKPDQWLLVKSDLKKKKEESMRTKIEKRYETKLEQIEQSIHRKGGIKKLEKVWERIGRAKENYSRAHENYEINVNHNDGVVTAITWNKRENNKRERSGVYFIRTNVEDKSAQQIWDIYNTIREVESTFRCLKTDLRIRPIFHQKDENSIAHIQLGLMAYQIVAAIRYQLKSHNMNHDWTNIVRIMNSNKMNTIRLLTKTKEVHLRKMSVPEDPVKEIYAAIGITQFPKTKRNYVVYH